MILTAKITDDKTCLVRLSQNIAGFMVFEMQRVYSI